MTTLHGRFFNTCDRFGENLNNFWERVRLFFYGHKTLFDFFFLITYSSEQLALLSLIMIFPKFSGIIVGTFIIMFLLTLNIEGFVWKVDIANTISK